MGWSKDHGTAAKVNAEYAKEQGNVAKQEATNLAELKSNVEAATQNASTAAENANAVIEDANTAASNADSAASEAIAQANHAKNEGDRAKAEADRLAGTDVSVLDNKVTNLSDSVNTKFGEVTTQLAQTTNMRNLALAQNLFKGKNAKSSLIVGNNQPIHGVVEYIASGFGGFKYWMAATPYVGYNEVIENPCIYASNDGENWVVPTGVTNPLSPAPVGDEIGKWHNSDTYLIYRADIKRLEIWWRKRYRTPVEEEVILRRTSTNGTEWTPTEELFRIKGISGDALSPIGNYDNNLNIYHCFTIKAQGGDTSITDYLRYYKADGEAKNWSHVKDIELSFEDGREREGWRIWHGDVKKIDGGFEAVLTAGNESTAVNMHLFYARSADGVNWSPLTEILSNSSPVDAKNIYHASILKTDNEQIIYYSGITEANAWTLNKTSVDVSSLSSIANEGAVNSLALKGSILNLETELNKMKDWDSVDLTTLPRSESKAWSANVGSKVTQINSTTRLALGVIEIEGGTNYTLSGFSYMNDVAYYLADINNVCLISSNRLSINQHGWQKNGHTFKSPSNAKYLFITMIRRNTAGNDEVLNANDFLLFNHNARLHKETATSDLMRLQKENSLLSENIRYVNSKYLVENIIQGVWTWTPGDGKVYNALAGFLQYLSCREINVIPGGKYIVDNIKTSLLSYFILDKEGLVVVEGGAIMGANKVITVPLNGHTLLINIRKSEGGNLTLIEAKTLFPDLSISLYKELAPSQPQMEIPELQNGFTSSGRFYKDNSGLVHLGGLYTPSTTTSNGTLIFTLPSSYRPKSLSVFQTPTAMIFVNIDGTVRLYNYGAVTNLSAISLDGVTFRTT